MESSNIKYIIYCRKSREDKDAQILSIQSQIEELEQYATTNSLQVATLYSESHSAAKQGRPVFNDVLNSIEVGQANALLVWKFDRLSRNESDTARIIKAFRDGILEEIRTPFETYRKGDNVLLLYIYFGMADEYSRQLSANVKRGNRTKLRLGQYPGCAPFGYRNYNRNNIKNIEPDENAPIIEKCFELYSTGEYPLALLRKNLNEKWVVKGKYGGKISKSVIQKMLRNPVYYGVISRNGELFDGAFEPIITKDLYDKVAAIIENKSHPRGEKVVNTYKRLLRCQECDSIYTGETRHKYYPNTDRHAIYHYYSCAKKKGICNQKPIKEKELEVQLIAKLTSVEFDKEEWDIARDLAILDLDKKRAFQHEVIGRYNKQIAQIDNMLSGLLELRSAKEITAEEYLAKKNEYINNKKSFEGKIKEVTKFADEKFGLVENFAEVIIQAQEILEGKDNEKKRNLLLSISSDVYIFEGKAKISFKKPFSFFFNREKDDKSFSMSGKEDLNLRPHGPKPRALAN
jgi:site-specific DNA recombinase